MTPACASVAVVIPAKNGEAHIAAALESVVSQTRRPDEIIVVDDGSTDRTVDIVTSFGEVRLLDNGGAGSNVARDHGVAASDCEFVAFLDHDDVWFPHHLETLLPLFDRVPDAVMSYSTARHFRGEPVIEAPRHHWPSLIDLWDTFPRSHPFESTSVVVRRSALDEIGGWPTWRRTTTDIYVWFRLADVGPFVHWPGGTAGYRRHPTSMSATALRERPISYLRNRFDLMAEALEHHLARHPGDADEMHRRLDLFLDLCDLVAAIDGADVDRMQDLVRHLSDADVATSDVPNIRSTLSGVLGSGPEAWRNALRCHRAWPEEAVDLRRLLLDPCLADAAVAAVRRQPLRPARWGILPSRQLRHLARPLAERAIGAASRRVGTRR